MFIAKYSSVFKSSESFRSHYGPGVDSTSDRNEYQDYFLGVKAAGALRADNFTTFMCRLSWNLRASTSWNPQGLYRGCFTFTFTFKIRNIKLLLLQVDCVTTWSRVVEKVEVVPAVEEISSVELEEGSLLCSQELFTFSANIFHPDVTVLFSQFLWLCLTCR